MSTTERQTEIVRNAIMMNSSPSIDRSDAHGCRGQAAYHVVDNHVGFIAQDIAQKFAEEKLELRVCRGCDLSGEFHVLTGPGCELCEGSEPVTAELLYDLASRIPRPKPRTGSNPFKYIAEDYELPYEVVVCFAEAVRKFRRGSNAGYWDQWALNELNQRLPLERRLALHDLVRRTLPSN